MSEIHQRLAFVALLVKEYDEAIAFYTQTLRFDLIEDTDLGNGKRWILISPPGAKETSLLLARAANEEQLSFVGNQTGNRVFLFLHTNDFWRDYEEMKRQGIVFNEQPRVEPYGTVVVFQDLYGNKWDLLEGSSGEK